MCCKQNEIEAVVEDLIENVIVEALAGTLQNAKECEIAVEMLKEKLDALALADFLPLFE